MLRDPQIVLRLYELYSEWRQAQRAKTANYFGSMRTQRLSSRFSKSERVSSRAKLTHIRLNVQGYGRRVRQQRVYKDTQQKSAS